MKPRARILRNGLFAAIPMAVAGYFYAQLAAMVLIVQPSPGETPADTSAIDALQWRVPLTLGAAAFALVAGFEWLVHGRRKPAPPPATLPDEARIQALLKEMESGFPPPPAPSSAKLANDPHAS